MSAVGSAALPSPRTHARHGFEWQVETFETCRSVASPKGGVHRLYSQAMQFHCCCARLECPITLVSKKALGIQFGIGFVLKPCSGLETCRKTCTLFQLYTGNTSRLMFFESIAPDTTPPSEGLVTLTQLTTRRLELSWTVCTEAE